MGTLGDNAIDLRMTLTLLDIRYNDIQLTMRYRYNDIELTMTLS